MGMSHSITRSEQALPDPKKSFSAQSSTSVDDEIEALMVPMPLFIREETFEERLYRKVTKEPLVPIGCGVTTYFLVSGIRSFMNRDSARSQLMMRGRVAAQACTVLAFCFYAGFNNLNFVKPSHFSNKSDAEREQK